MNMDQLINSLCRSDDAVTFSGLELDSGESLADTAAQSGVIDVRPFRKADRVSSLATTKPSSGHWRQTQGVGKG